VREGLARGFPIVNAYFDTDIESNIALKQYCLTFANDSSALNFDKIKKFINQINLDKEHPAKIRALAESLIDMNYKMKKMISYLELYN
jgi:hypothetical protein